MNKKLIAVLGAGAILLGASACSPPQDNRNATEKAADEVKTKSNARAPYVPKNDVEFLNYNKAQQVADNPASILWCTAFPAGNSAQVITVPIKGKLTSSSTSYFPGSTAHGNSVGNWMEENKSVDGMFHGNPPGYRYGFTPGGQYVSFEGGMNVMCTTALTEFQRKNTFVSVEDNTANDVQKQAEAALKSGNPKKAQDLLKSVGTK